MNLSIFKPKTSAASAAPTETPAPAGESLEDVLLELAKWGCPYLHCHRDGEWSARVDANITPLGAKFEVRSEFNCKTPMQAALQCRERLLAAVKTIGGAA
jgi:hypothetical protein